MGTDEYNVAADCMVATAMGLNWILTGNDDRNPSFCDIRSVPNRRKQITLPRFMDVDSHTRLVPTYPIAVLKSLQFSGAPYQDPLYGICVSYVDYLNTSKEGK